MVVDLLCLGLQLYWWVLLLSIVSSFALAFGWRPPPQLLPAMGLIRSLTDPVFGLIRPYMPAVGGLDLSPIIVFLALRLAMGALGC